MTARETALNILMAIEAGGGLSDKLLKKNIEKAQLSKIDRNLTREIVSGVMRHKSRLDWILDRSLKKGTKSLNPIELSIFRVGLYQIAFLDKIPNFAAVDESVKLVKRFGRKEIIGLTNAVLRDIIRRKRYLDRADTGNRIKDLCLNYSHPAWLIERWQKQLGWEETVKLLEADNTPAPVIIRTNLLKSSPEKLFQELSAGGYGPRLVENIPAAIEVTDPSGLVDDELFVRGHFYVQDSSAQAAAMLAQGKKGELIVDLCSAPGGKAGAVIEQTEDDCCFWALDVSFGKLKMIRENFIRLGYRSYFLVNGNAVSVKSKRNFDLVLADVPCSGLGVLRRRLDLRWRIKESDISRLARIQEDILENAAGLVKPGGSLVYSTCTVTPEENRQQIEEFLKRHSEFSIDPAGKYLPPGLVEDKYLVTWPHRHFMDGAFAARLVKKL